MCCRIDEDVSETYEGKIGDEKKIILAVVSILVIMLTACGGEPPKSTLKFIEGKKVTIQENDYIGVFFTYTNNSGETVLPADEFDVKAFQNGKELNVVVYSGEKVHNAIPCDTSMQNGTTPTVIWTFEAQDNSTVSIECNNGEKVDFELKETIR